MFEPIEEIQVNGVQDAENILKSIGFESADSLIEKAKWKVGDEKQYQGVTWVVGGFNAKGAPLWRKKKDGGSSAPSVQTSAPAAKTAPAQKSPAEIAANKIIGLLTISDSKYKDISKVVAVRTDKGNWAMEYAGSNTGLIINSKTLPESELKCAGVEIKEPKKAEEKPIVPNAILKYGNRPSRQLDKLYKDFDDKYKNYTADQLQKEIDKMGNAIYNEKYMYRAMQRDGAGKISLNKQGNRVDEVIAKSYTLKRLLETKKANSGSDKTTSSPKTNKTSGSSGIPTKEQALKKIDDFTKNYKIRSFTSDNIAYSIENHTFRLSEKLRQEKFPWLDGIGRKDQANSIKYVIADSVSGGAKEVAKKLNESGLGSRWEAVREWPVLKLKATDGLGNAHYVTISKKQSEVDTKNTTGKVQSSKNKVNPYSGLKTEELRQKRDKYMSYLKSASSKEKKYVMDIVDKIDEVLLQRKKNNQ